MSYKDNLFSIKGKKGMFSIILTATILTIFEIVFFYNIVAPNVNNQMDNTLKKIGQQIAEKINTSTNKLKKQNVLADIMISEGTGLVINNVNDNVLMTSAEREHKLVTKINNYTMYTGVIIIIVLLILLYLLWNSIKSDPRLGNIINITFVEDSDMTESVLTAIFTVVILISFQILFYFFGQQFKYPGSMGNDELLNEIIDSIQV
jgi:uncharacterized membrane protein